MKRGTASFDGGIRGGRGPHACAAVLEIENELPRQQGRYLGPTGTNNQAELQGMLLAMRLAAEAGVTHLTLRSDSKLIVEQALGNWRIKDASLRQLHAIGAEYAMKWFEDVQIDHIPRELNKEADAICTALLDTITSKPRGN